MATKTQATAALAPVIPRVTSELAARKLREADPESLFFEGKPGGRSVAAHQGLPQLVNLILAVVAADPITQAPEVVRLYRDLKPVRRTIATTSYDGEGRITVTQQVHEVGVRDPTILGGGPLPWDDAPNDSLGSVLEHILRRYEPKTSSLIEEFKVWRPTPWVEVTLRTGPWETETHAFGPSGVPFGTRRKSPVEDPPAGVILQCAWVPAEAFKILAELGRDTERAISKAGKHENGPPASTGEPDSLDDKPRGANPEAQDVLSKSSVCVSDVQPRSESRGRSSDGSSHPQTEISDDDYPDRRSNSVAASAA